MYRNDRDSNAGLPIDHDSSAVTSPINLNAMKWSDYADFNSTLDSGLHGMVHVLVGTVTGMGAIPFAGRDALFWMHHCNIDRIWASWNKAGETNPTNPSWLTQQFIFADENCNRVVATIADFNAIDQLSYTYDYLLREHPIRIPLQEYEICILRRIVLPPGPEALALEIPFERESGSLREVIGSLKTNERVVMTVQDLTASAPVGAVFEIFLCATGKSRRVARGTPGVGAINFFDAVHREGVDITSSCPFRQ